MLRLTADADLRHRLGSAGREHTQHEFEWTDKFEIVRRVYWDLSNRV